MAQFVVEYIEKRNGKRSPSIYEVIDSAQFVASVTREQRPYWYHENDFDAVELQEDFVSLFSEVNKVSVMWAGSIEEYKRLTVAHLRKQRIIERMIARLGNPDIIVECAVENEDYGGYYKDTSRHTLRSVLDELYNEDSRFDLASMNIKQIGDMYRDEWYDSHITFFGTEEDWNNCQAEKRRQELESTAARVAADHGVKLNTIEFLNAVDRELNHVEQERETWNNPEVRAEEWAAHMYAGSREAYFDDHNFENGRYESRIDMLSGIMDWVSERCPLLWAQFEEQRLQEQNDEV